MSSSSIYPNLTNRLLPFDQTRSNPIIQRNKAILLICKGEENRNKFVLHSKYQRKYFGYDLSFIKISKLDISSLFHKTVNVQNLTSEAYVVVCSGEKATMEYPIHLFLKAYPESLTDKSLSGSPVVEEGSYSSGSDDATDLPEMGGMPSIDPCISENDHSSGRNLEKPPCELLQNKPRGAKRKFETTAIFPLKKPIQQTTSIEKESQHLVEYLHFTERPKVFSLIKGATPIEKSQNSVRRYMYNCVNKTYALHFGGVESVTAVYDRFLIWASRQRIIKCDSLTFTNTVIAWECATLSGDGKFFVFPSLEQCKKAFEKSAPELNPREFSFINEETNIKNRQLSIKRYLYNCLNKTYALHFDGVESVTAVYDRFLNWVKHQKIIKCAPLTFTNTIIAWECATLSGDGNFFIFPSLEQCKKAYEKNTSHLRKQ